MSSIVYPDSCSPHWTELYHDSFTKLNTNKVTHKSTKHIEKQCIYGNLGTGTSGCSHKEWGKQKGNSGTTEQQWHAQMDSRWRYSCCSLDQTSDSLKSWFFFYLFSFLFIYLIFWHCAACGLYQHDQWSWLIVLPPVMLDNEGRKTKEIL